MKVLTLFAISLFVLGLFTLTIPSTFAQPCENNGHSVLGSGKQIFKQSNRCVIVESNIPSGSVCPINTVLQNGVCVPISSTCPIGTFLQNGVCVPFTNPTQSAPVAVPIASPSSTTHGNFVQLNGLSSFATTSGATIVSYSWVQTSGPSQTLSGSNTSIASFIATLPTATTTPTTLTFSLTVTDSNGRVSAPTSVAVTITS